MIEKLENFYQVEKIEDKENDYRLINVYKNQEELKMNYLVSDSLIKKIESDVFSKSIKVEFIVDVALTNEITVNRTTFCTEGNRKTDILFESKYNEMDNWIVEQEVNDPRLKSEA